MTEDTKVDDFTSIFGLTMRCAMFEVEERGRDRR